MLYKLFFEHSPDMMLIFRDSDWRIIKANEAAVKAYGYTREELLTNHFCNLHFSEDRNSIVSRINEAKPGCIIETIHRRKDGTEFPVEVSLRGTVINEEKVFFCVARDITERKQTEEKLQAANQQLLDIIDFLPDATFAIDLERELVDRIIQTSPAGIVVLNSEREIIYANTRAMQVLGLRKDSTTHRVYRTPGRLFIDYEGNPIPDEDTVFRRVMVTGQSYYDIPQAIEWPDGIRTLLSINGAPLFDRSGRIEGVVLSVDDITERKKTEERISDYQKQLRSLAAELSLIEERERRRIAGCIHDHIGQSLAVARLKLGALRKETSSSHFFENIDEIVALIEETIQNARSLTFELSPPILYDLGFEAAVEWLGEEILERNGVKFSFKNDGQPKPLDEELRIILFTAVRELFFNIVKHAKAQWTFIFIRKHSEKIQVKVKDNGIGFDYGLYGPGSGKAVGFGLLSINERLKHLGGSLDIVSKPGYGTSVTIEAPLKSRN